jgi:hypothetical protein
MLQNPVPGQVLFYKDYQFDDGTTSDKLFVVLWIADINSKCLVLKTTSQPKRYCGCSEGCDIKKRAFFIPTTWRECFPLNTYIQLPQIIEISSAGIFAGILSKRMTLKSGLSGDCLRKLKACLQGFKNDIAPAHWDLIFK